MQYTEQAIFVPAKAAQAPACGKREHSRRLQRPGQTNRRGIASVLAMLYLFIFSALALGFFSAVTMAVQIARNDEKALGAQIACESGLEFMQYQLSRVRVPGSTAPADVMTEVHQDLLAQQANSDNVGGRGITLDNGTIHFPGGPDDYIALDADGAGFRADITDVGDGWLRVIAHGRYRGMTISRTIEMYFESVQITSTIFDFGIVTRGPIRLTGGAHITSGVNPRHADVLSLARVSTPLTMSGNASIDGDVFMTQPGSSVSISGNGSIGGSSVPSVRAGHVHAGNPNPEPELPSVDTRMFLPFATNRYQPGQRIYTNTFVPPNTNPNFSGGTTIEGVLYVMNPNRVSFSGQTTVRGSIVVENGAVAGRNNEIKFSGGATVYGMETLPDTPAFPPALKALRGSALLAPGYAVTLSGQSGSIGGTMVADSFTLSGGSGGVIEGTLIGLGTADLTITGGASISRNRPTGPIPAGLVFDKTYKPMYETYHELQPGQAPTPLVLTQASGFGGPVDLIVAALRGSAGSAPNDGGFSTREIRHTSGIPSAHIPRRTVATRRG